MNQVLVLSNCSHPLDPARPAALSDHVDQAPRAAARAGRSLQDNVTGIVRAFAFTDRLYA